MSKSASTFLQQSFFENNSNFYYTGLYNNKKIINNYHNELFNINLNNKYYSISDLHELVLILANQDKYLELPKNLINNINKEKLKASNLNKIFVYSNEHFCESVNPLFQANLLKQVFNNPKILIIIRNQKDIIKSHYLYQGNKLLFVPDKYKGRFVDFKSYFNYLLFTNSKRGGHKARDWVYDFLRIIDYNNFIKINEKIFGRENIIVAPFEEIINDPNVLNKYLSAKIDFNFKYNNTIDMTKVRSSISPRGLILIRILKTIIGNYDDKNKKYSRKIIKYFKLKFPNLHTLLTRGGKKLTIPTDIENKIHNQFKDGNAEIAKNYNLNLKKYGYPL